LLLFGFVVSLTAAGVVTTLALYAAANKTIQRSARLNWIVDRVALALVVLSVLLISARSRLFGVDTAAYSVVFNAYCAEQDASQLGLSFYLSAKILDFLMLGACDVRLLPMAWVLVVVIGILMATGTFADKLRYLALLLISLVGVELTTNALRQGLSTAFLVAAVSWWPRQRLFSIGLAALAVSLHVSAALVVVAVVIAGLGWGWFTLVSFASMAVILAALRTGFAGGPVGDFLYEIRKYLLHDPDELWIRILSYTSLALIVVIPFLASKAAAGNEIRFVDGPYARVTKLVVSGVPLLLLPYFGYRYIYGVLPVALWLAVGALNRSQRLAAQVFFLLLLGNIGVLAVWSYGSTYMRSVPFFE